MGAQPGAAREAPSRRKRQPARFLVVWTACEVTRDPGSEGPTWGLTLALATCKPLML